MVNLLMAVHGHQPVGNFPKVIEEAFSKSYAPFIEVLKRHPSVKLAVHFSGSLLDWLKENHSEYIKALSGLVKSGQIEIFSGGFYEPILTLIPEEDAQEQIVRLSLEVENTFSFSALGGWIAERVWEPKLPLILARAGLKYGVIDDSHFSLTSISSALEKVNPDELSGYYLTEEQGQAFAVFPGSEKLRYYLPFKLPEETIKYFKERMYRKQEVAISFGDDIEKFGLWPGTFKWVYQENWLDNFFRCLEENSLWLKTMTFKEYYSSHKPSGRVYLSCASYREMQEWSKGYYRNFMVKYPEVNNMHKKMFYLSNKIRKEEKMPRHKPLDIELAKKHLFMAQANDAYWHGVFGGLYLYHLRSAVQTNMIEAQKALESQGSVKKTAGVEVKDFDLDGYEEILVNTESLSLHFRPGLGATLSNLDYKMKSCNLADTLMRRPEVYHQKLKQLLEEKRAKFDGSNSSQPASIHDLFQVKGAGLNEELFYDQNPRYCFIERFLSVDTTYEDFVKCRYFEMGDFAAGAYQFALKGPAKEARVVFSRTGKVNSLPITVEKSIATKSAGILAGYAIKNLDGQGNLEAVFGVEFNFSVFDIELVAKKEMLGINSLKINDSWRDLKLNLSSDEKTSVWVFPVETVSDSETGIEKTYQELCCFFWWKIKLSPHQGWKNALILEIA